MTPSDFSQLKSCHKIRVYHIPKLNWRWPLKMFFCFHLSSLPTPLLHGWKCYASSVFPLIQRKLVKDDAFTPSPQIPSCYQNSGRVSQGYHWAVEKKGYLSFKKSLFLGLSRMKLVENNTRINPYNLTIVHSIKTEEKLGFTKNLLLTKITLRNITKTDKQQVDMSGPAVFEWVNEWVNWLAQLSKTKTENPWQEKMRNERKKMRNEINTNGMNERERNEWPESPMQFR